MGERCNRAAGPLSSTLTASVTLFQARWGGFLILRHRLLAQSTLGTLHKPEGTSVFPTFYPVRCQCCLSAMTKLDLFKANEHWLLLSIAQPLQGMNIKRREKYFYPSSPHSWLDVMQFLATHPNFLIVTQYNLEYWDKINPFLVVLYKVIFNHSNTNESRRLFVDFPPFACQLLLSGTCYFINPK